ncbi:hypothetical protein UFOVP49_62 [uncultured Caudovirales phage]|uniref:Uncharacterized protein n=1 Tax=uncultured Caudovirales phage TaxID=2100421 RepID=A0A6J5KQN5_9CAUD|nr:hypothetical protein UFOVP49_62 [uncultured Caudovirales phage]
MKTISLQEKIEAVVYLRRSGLLTEGEEKALAGEPKGPAVLTHAGAVRDGLSGSFKKTKVATLVDLAVGQVHVFKVPTSQRFELVRHVVGSTVQYVQNRHGRRYSVTGNRINGSLAVIRVA